jgi:hypothetical protein
VFYYVQENRKYLFHFTLNPNRSLPLLLISLNVVYHLTAADHWTWHASKLCALIRESLQHLITTYQSYQLMNWHSHTTSHHFRMSPSYVINALFTDFLSIEHNQQLAQYMRQQSCSNSDAIIFLGSAVYLASMYPARQNMLLTVSSQ